MEAVGLVATLVVAVGVLVGTVVFVRWLPDITIIASCGGCEMARDGHGQRLPASSIG